MSELSRRWTGTLVIVLAVALAGCAAQRTAAPGSRPDVSDPTRLVGMWKVTGAVADNGNIVGLTPSELIIYRPCGELMAAWNADVHGSFLGDISGSSGDCDPLAPVAWLEKTAAYRLEDGNAALLDVEGRTVALLVPASEPPRPDRESFAITDEFRRSFADTATLPSNLRPAGRAELVGRWVPVGGVQASPKPAHLELRGDGRYAAWDGCNGSGGGWTVKPAGTVLATAGVSTLIGCDNVPVGQWLSSARLAGFDGETLVLFDPQAAELGRLRRAKPAASSTGRSNSVTRGEAHVSASVPSNGSGGDRSAD
ncbi:hypothetical protein AB0J80_25505 [Actinoplanes sp. NPDC049548]|uniref:META domain-containing protein n=1 Tax=Actinoplanes sp. NPDC049548 TaxID=3155152 RepID=UPI00343F39F2